MSTKNAARMTKFDAILAKNHIARELRDQFRFGEDININWIMFNLKELEQYVGEGNQPSVEDIFESELL